MNRRDFAALLLASLAPAACDWFAGDKKAVLPGERISVLGLDRSLQPDPDIAKQPVALPRPVVNPDWPQAGGYPNHAMYHLALPSGLKRVWTADVGDGSSRYRRVMSQPVVDGGVVYAMDGGVQVSAFDARDGRRKWRVALKPEDERGNAFGGGPAFWNNRLFVATGYAQVVALDPGSGKVIWRRGVGAPVHAPPTVSDGRVFAVTVENELITLAAEDGRQLWTHNGIPETAGLLGGTSPAVEGEIVVAAYNSGELFALRVENGRVLWSDSLAATRRPRLGAGDRQQQRAVGGRRLPLRARQRQRAGLPDPQRGQDPLGQPAGALRGREEEIRPDPLVGPGARRRPADRAVERRLGGVGLALHRRAARPREHLGRRLSRPGDRRQFALRAQRRRRSLRLSLRLAGCARDGPVDRHHRAAECRQIDAVQPARGPAAGAGGRHSRGDARQP